MSLAVQHASIAAWNDEAHVRENRAMYRDKFAAVVPLLQPVMDIRRPDAGFYLWAGVPLAADARLAVPGDDERFTKELFATTHITVLPGCYLAREAHGVNPGHGYVRMALVPDTGDCIEAASRIAAFCGRR
jgi:N-succinyldiaminopimelate aminotransferase